MTIDSQSALDAIGPVNPNGQAMREELLYIHGLIRSNLDSINALTAQVSAGLAADEIQQQVATLKSDSIVWTLRLGCMRYCRFVHGHHGLEDAALFPGLTGVNPSLTPIVDKLMADHRLVSGLLDRIERAATALGVVPQARPDLIDALSQLTDHLLTHLDYEEAEIIPTLERLREWPIL